MSRPTDSLWVSLSALVVVVIASVGVTREGFTKAETAINNSTQYNQTAGELEAFTGLFVELLPVLALVLAGVVVVRTVQ